MKRMISGMIFLFIVIYFIIYCVNDKEPKVMESTNERMEWETTLTDEQIQELNDYFKALTIIHFQDYECDEERLYVSFAWTSERWFTDEGRRSSSAIRAFEIRQALICACCSPGKGRFNIV